MRKGVERYIQVFQERNFAGEDREEGLLIRRPKSEPLQFRPIHTMMQLLAVLVIELVCPSCYSQFLKRRQLVHRLEVELNLVDNVGRG